MPRPLSELTADEQGLYSALSQQPQATDLPSLLADNAEDRGEEARAALLHRDAAHLALWELLRRRALTDGECAQVLRQPSEDTTRQVSHLLGHPDPNAPLPDVLTEDGLKAQLAFAQTLLTAYGLPIGSVRAEDVWLRLQTNKALREQVEHGGRSLLLLVPRVPLAICTAALADGLRRNEHLLGPGDRRLHNEPVHLNPLYGQQQLKYLAPTQGANTPDLWLSEQQWMAEKDVDALFVAPAPDVPAEHRNCSAANTWWHRRRGEALLTPQAWCILFLTLLERRGQKLDGDTVSLFTGARFARPDGTLNSFVPNGDWILGNWHVYMGYIHLEGFHENIGVRVASEGI